MINNAITYTVRNSPYALGAIGVIGGVYLFGRLVQYCMAPTKPMQTEAQIKLKKQLSEYYAEYPEAYKKMPTRTVTDLQNLIDTFLSRTEKGRKIFDHPGHYQFEKQSFVENNLDSITKWVKLIKKEVSIMDETAIKAKLKTLDDLMYSLNFAQSGRDFLETAGIKELQSLLVMRLKEVITAKEIAASIAQSYKKLLAQKQ